MAEDDREPGDRDDNDYDAGDDWADESEALTPETVAYKSFAAARRGVSETEVRAFLQDVAAEMAAAVGRERDLLAKVHELEERLTHLAAHPPAPTEEELLEQLGEETARVLRSAQEAADEIRASASKRAQAIAGQAEDEASRLREAAKKVLDERSREADIAATVTLREAEGHAQARMREVAREAEAEIEAARQRGREMVGEARAVRERILADLGKRRSVVQGEIAQLEAAREQILESGRLVRARLAQAAEAFSPFEPEQLEPEGSVPDATAPDAPAVDADEGDEQDAPAAEDDDRRDPGSVDSFPVLELVETPEELAGAVQEPGEAVEEVEEEEEEEEEAEEEGEEIEAAADVPEPDVPDFVAQGPEPDIPEFVEAKSVHPAGGRANVDELFARIRAGRENPVADAPVALATEPEPEPPTVEVEIEPAPEPEPETEPELEPEVNGDAGLLASRDEVLAPVNQDLLRRAKRALQDEQNELLDRLRRERGRADADHLLAPLSALVTDWADVLGPAVNEAYSAGRTAQSSGGQAGEGPPGAAAPRRLVSGLAEVLVTPLRERLVATLDAGPIEPGPEREAELSTRVGARYREWRAQELEYRVGDVLAAAYAKGVYDAAPEGSQLRWIPAKVGECPDADDNALEPTTRGSSFPTGQPFPPAHPGCRCLIAVTDTD